MVSPDWNESAATPQTTDAPVLSFEPAILARPLDRLAAMIIDIFVVLMPIYILLSAPLKKWMTVSFLLGSEAEFIANIFGMVIAATMLIVFYQTLCHHFFKATIGKMLFKIQVVPMFPGQKLTLWDQFTRSWVFNF